MNIRSLQKTLLNQTLKKQLYFFQSKGVKQLRHQRNYFEVETNNELEEMKEWLNRVKPKYLCIYFTNNWNPVAKRANEDYNKFTTKTELFVNFRVDTDKNPKLKWFFDNKVDPGVHLYYYGHLLSSFGGINFDRVLKEIKRSQDTIEDSAFKEIGYHNTEYEMPYYDYERRMDLGYGNGVGQTKGQLTIDHPFNPYTLNIKEFAFEERWIVNRLKK